jgi:hypothetical protein
MEYEEGESLSAYLRKHGGFLDEPLLLNIFIPILTGLQAVHEAGLLHMDIKPDNIYLRANGSPLLIDFGSARQYQSGSEQSQKVALSRGYAALEQYPNQGARGPWTDVYGIGATLYRCVTGKDPLDALDRERTLGRTKVDPLRPARTFERPLYSKHLRECIDAALRLAADRRPPSARALQNGLMGKALVDDRKQNFVPFGRGAGFFGLTENIRAIQQKVAARSALEKLVLGLVFLATAAVVVPKILVGLDVFSEEEFYDTVAKAPERATAAGRELVRYVNEQWFGVKYAALLPTPAAPRSASKDKLAETKVIAPFNPAPQLAQQWSLPAPASTVVLLQDGALVAVGLSDGRVRVLRSDSGATLREFTAQSETAAVLAASPDGRWLALPGANREIVLWDSASDAPPLTLPGHPEPLTALAFSPDGKLLASAAADETLLLWDVAAGKRLSAPLKTRAAVLAFSFTPNGRTLAAGDRLGGIQYVEIPAGRDLGYVLSGTEAITALAHSPDGKWLLLGGRNGFLKLTQVGIERDDRVLSGAPETIHALAFTPDREWILAGGTDEAITAWKSDGSGPEHRRRAHSHDIYALAVSSDGRVLVTAGDDLRLILWK